jgi:cation diffusion facilitator family transporter
VLGLAVNLASAWILRGDHHHQGHDHHGGHDGHDNNLRAAYLHVLADALTSVLAIVALAAGSLYGWQWMDPAMGIVGALVIARWSWGLVRDAGRVLVDYIPPEEDLPEEIRDAVETGGDRITDLHVWQVGPGHHAAIVALRSDAPQEPSSYKARLAHIHDLSHVTVEVQKA